MDRLSFLRSAIEGNRDAAVVGPANYTALEFTDCSVKGNKSDRLPEPKPFAAGPLRAEFQFPRQVRP